MTPVWQQSERETQQAKDKYDTVNQAQTNAGTILLLLLYEKHFNLYC